MIDAPAVRPATFTNTALRHDSGATGIGPVSRVATGYGKCGSFNG